MHHIKDIGISYGGLFAAITIDHFNQWLAACVAIATLVYTICKIVQISPHVIRTFKHWKRK